MIQPSRLRVDLLRGGGMWSWQVKPLAVCCLLAAAMVAHAADAPVAKARLQTVSAEQFQTHVRNLQGLVQACDASAPSCDVAKVGDDDRVDAMHFQMRWGWLRDAVSSAHDAKPAERATLMTSAANRLDEIAKQNALSADAQRAAQFAKARADANNILNGEEFQSVEQQSWWDRKVAAFWLWLGRGLSGMQNLGSAWPWIVRVLEGLLFGGAAVGLLYFVRQNLQRQRLAVALNSQALELAWSRESNDWAAQAEVSARDGDWRDAVHCLYWATIVMLEGRRAWRHNPARTPREYVQLLKPGSPQQGALRALTQIFERLWYGLRTASPRDYEKARALYENLRDKTAAVEAA